MKEQMERDLINQEIREGHDMMPSNESLQSIDKKALEIIKAAETEPISIEKDNEERVNNIQARAVEAGITPEERRRVIDGMGMEERLKLLGAVADCMAESARRDSAEISGQKIPESPIPPDPEKRKTLIKFLGEAVAFLGSRLGPSEALAGEDQLEREGLFELTPEVEKRFDKLPPGKEKELLAELVMKDPRERVYFTVDRKTFLQKEAGYDTFGYIDLSLAELAKRKGVERIRFGHTHPFAMYRIIDPKGCDQYMKDKSSEVESQLVPGNLMPSLLDISSAWIQQKNRGGSILEFEAREPNGIWEYSVDLNNPDLTAYGNMKEEIDRGMQKENFLKESAEFISEEDLRMAKDSENFQYVIERTDPRDVMQGRSELMPMLSEKEKEIFGKYKDAAEKIMLDVAKKYDLRMLIKFHNYTAASQRMGTFYERDSQSGSDRMPSNLLLRDSETARKQQMEELIKHAEGIGIKLKFHPYDKKK